MDRLNSNQHSFATTTQARVVGLRVAEWNPEEGEEQLFDPNRPMNRPPVNLVRTSGAFYENLHSMTVNIPVCFREIPENPSGRLEDVIKQEEQDKEKKNISKD